VCVTPSSGGRPSPGASGLNDAGGIQVMGVVMLLFSPFFFISGFRQASAEVMVF